MGTRPSAKEGRLIRIESFLREKDQIFPNSHSMSSDAEGKTEGGRKLAEYRIG